MRKRIVPSELAYVLGIIALALGTAWMERSDFGVSMVVAPAYVFYRKLSIIWPWFTFGTAEYTLQAVLLVVLCLILGKFRVSYLFSFVTAVFYGFVLDGCMLVTALIPGSGTAVRILFYLAGMLMCSTGVSLLFHTYVAPEVYELLVKLLSGKYRKDIHRFKTWYDCCSCAAGILLSFLFFGFGTFIGVRLGTVFCALINGRLIGLCSRLFEKVFRFEDRLPFRSFFEG